MKLIRNELFFITLYHISFIILKMEQKKIAAALPSVICFIWHVSCCWSYKQRNNVINASYIVINSVFIYLILNLIPFSLFLMCFIWNKNVPTHIELLCLNDVAFSRTLNTVLFAIFLISSYHVMLLFFFSILWLRLNNGNKPNKFYRCSIWKCIDSMSSEFSAKKNEANDIHTK